MKKTIEICPSPPCSEEREGPAPHGSAQSAARGQAAAWEGEAGLCELSGIPHLTPTLSAPRGGEVQVGDLRITWRLRSLPAFVLGDPPGRPNPMPSASS